MKDAATKSYLKKGQDVVDMNHKAIDAGATAFHKFEVPADWATATDEPEGSSRSRAAPPLVKHGQGHPRARRPHGRRLACPSPPSSDHVDGQFELGASAYEKRGVAVIGPEVGRVQVHPVQQLRLSCARTPPSAPSSLTDEEVAMPRLRACASWTP